MENESYSGMFSSYRGDESNVLFSGRDEKHRREPPNRLINTPLASLSPPRDPKALAPPGATDEQRSFPAPTHGTQEKVRSWHGYGSGNKIRKRPFRKRLRGPAFSDKTFSHTPTPSISAPERQLTLDFRGQGSVRSRVGGTVGILAPGDRLERLFR